MSEELKYAAAILDSKASVYVGEKGTTITVTDTDERIVRWLQRVLGGECYAHNRRSRKVVYRWRVVGAIAERVSDSVVGHMRFRTSEFLLPRAVDGERGVRGHPILPREDALDANR